MAKVVFIRGATKAKDGNVVLFSGENKITFIADDGTQTDFECRADFFATSAGGTATHEELPDGNYILNAEEPPAENNSGYGTFYISTGDNRGRDIHGGGSDTEDPFADRQGWEPTYGCLRMQNEDGQALSRLIIDAGNDVEFEVKSE
jgi:hypothetical protein